MRPNRTKVVRKIRKINFWTNFFFESWRYIVPPEARTRETVRTARLGLVPAEGASFSATQGFKWLVSVCRPSVTDFSDFYEAHMRRLHPLFPLVIFQLGFSGIPENHEKTEKSYLQERSRRTLFWDPFFVIFF